MGLCEGLKPFWHSKSTRRCGNYIFFIRERFSSIFLWYNDTSIVACNRWASCLWANSYQMDVSNGANDEGFEGLCSFHGMTWRVNSWRLHVGRKTKICDWIFARIWTCVHKSLGCRGRSLWRSFQRCSYKSCV